MRSKLRMSGPDFEAVRPFLTRKISEARIEAARLALVDGQTLQGVANLQTPTWSRQAVGDAVRVVWAAYEQYKESQRAVNNAGALLPPGWEQVTLIAPTELVAQFRNQIATYAPPPTPVKKKQRAATAKVAPAKKARKQA